jgi:hypothetical protein
VHYEGVGDCTSRRQHAHIIESRVVQYRWHPWHQQAVYVYGKSARGEEPVLRCAREQEDVARALEIPQWMLDPIACARMSFGDAPSVSVGALRDVFELMRVAGRSDVPPVLQAEHEHQPGGAYATPDKISAEGPTGIVSGAADESDLGKSAGGSTDSGAEAPGPISATASRRRRVRRGAP